MHPAYVADFGDYPKFGILRCVGRGLRVGVVWWICAGAVGGNDGQRREYLTQPDQWQRYDPILFAALQRINEAHHRDIHALEDPVILPGAIFFSEPVPCDGATPISQRITARVDWLMRAAVRVRDCDVVFLDPDNGFAAPGFNPESPSAGKSIMIDELMPFLDLHDTPARTVIVYHHQTRRRGGHLAELRHLSTELQKKSIRVTGVLRARPWSPRAFFILNGDRKIAARARHVARVWTPHLTWHTNQSLEQTR